MRHHSHSHRHDKVDNIIGENNVKKENSEEDSGKQKNISKSLKLLMDILMPQDLKPSNEIKIDDEDIEDVQDKKHKKHDKHGKGKIEDIVIVENNIKCCNCHAFTGATGATVETGANGFTHS